MAINARQKGKRIERAVADKLRPFFPNVRRNANGQSQGHDQRDLLETGYLSVEIKGGNSYKTGFFKNVLSFLDQTVKSAPKGAIPIVWYKPDRAGKDHEMVIMPSWAFINLLKKVEDGNTDKG